MLEEAIDDLWEGGAETTPLSIVSSLYSEFHALRRLERRVAHLSTPQLFGVRYGMLLSVLLLHMLDRLSLVRGRMTGEQT